jgi:hypothetical protein
MGRIERCTRRMGGLIEEKRWKYDSVGRIVDEEYTPVGASTPLRTQRFYDGDDVLRREIRDVVQGGSVVQETNNQDRAERGRIVARNGSPLTYDNNGNLTDGV